MGTKESREKQSWHLEEKRKTVRMQKEKGRQE